MNYQFEEMLRAAKAAAKEACAAEGPENMNVLDCGFAWVTVDGNSQLARYCRKMSSGGSRDRQFYGAKSYVKGWQWWNPGEFGGQAIGHKEAGAKAFRQVLADYGISAEVHSRFD